MSGLASIFFIWVENYCWCMFSSEHKKYKKEREKMQDWCRVIFNLENQTISNPPNSRNTFSGLPRTNFIFGKLCKVKLVSGFRFFWWNFACYQLLPWNASSIILLSGRSEEGFLRDKPNLFGNQKFEVYFLCIKHIYGTLNWNIIDLGSFSIFGVYWPIGPYWFDWNEF